ncbi:MAG: apolipoprotein N-acyltransferase, partial [Ignavibacteria bacterium]|nr:apolipoprotein N-acyltransferase [Ignavibacteria bacterium]
MKFPINFIITDSPKKTILSCILSGIFLALSYPPFKTWFLVYPGMLLLLYVIINSDKLIKTFFRSYLALLILNAITLYWISGWHSDDTFLKIGGVATILVHPVLMCIPLLIFHGVCRYNKNLGLILFPFLWVGFEYFHNQWQLNFPWLELGNTESYNINRIQYAELFGVHGISFLICSVNSMIYFLVSSYANRQNTIIQKIIYSLTILLILFPNIYSYYTLRDYKPQYLNFGHNENTLKLSLIQTNTDPFKKWGSEHEELIDSYIQMIKEAVAHKPDLIVLHETATPFYFLEDYNAVKTQKFINIVDSSDIPLLMGIPHLEYYTDSSAAPPDARKMKGSGRLYDTYNASILLEPGKNEKNSTIHKKVKLVPFSEKVPYSNYLPFLKEWIKWGVGLSGWQFGEDMTVFKLKNRSGKEFSFSVLICFESVFSELVSEGVRSGAEFLVIITNDGWFGETSGPVQHMQYAVLR